MLEEVYKLLYAVLRKEFGQAVINLGEGKYELRLHGRTYKILVWSLDTRRPDNLRRLGDLPEDLLQRIKRTLAKYTFRFDWHWTGGHLQCLTPTVPFEVAFLEDP